VAGLTAVTGWELRLVEDTLAAGAAVALPADGANRAVYVAHGGIAAGDAAFTDDTAWHGTGAAPATLRAGPQGAALWRFELARAGAPVVAATGGRTLEKLRAPLDGGGLPPEGPLLLRCDSVAFPPGGCAFLHTHQGPGIRCLIEGGIRIDTHGTSTAYAPGGAWFEAGPEPVFAQAAADRPSRFVRVMVLPARLKGQSSIRYLRKEDQAKPKSQRYKGYLEVEITP
jgi:hypothetical protein